MPLGVYHRISIVLFLDFAKALDKVPHRRLVSKLKSHGIQGKILDWISEWLRGRVHRVCIRDVKSSWHYDDAPKWTIACTEMDIFMYRNCSL